MTWWPWLLVAFGAGALAVFAALYIAANIDNPESWWGRK